MHGAFISHPIPAVMMEARCSQPKKETISLLPLLKKVVLTDNKGTSLRCLIALANFQLCEEFHAAILSKFTCTFNPRACSLPSHHFGERYQSPSYMRDLALCPSCQWQVSREVIKAASLKAWKNDAEGFNQYIVKLLTLSEHEKLATSSRHDCGSS